MFNVPVKIDGASTVNSEELNSGFGEEKNVVTDSGQSLTGANLFQISIAAAINAAGATFYVDSGAADAYVLSKAGSVSLRSPIAYFEGMSIRFRPGNSNTGASTVNVAALGVKSIIKADGVSALSAGDLSTATDAVARYDLSADAFLLFPGTVIATKNSRGLAYLGDQRITLSNSPGDLPNDIDFSGGRFTFDDGTGQQIVSALTKRLDAAFTAGDGQGGLDTGSKANLSWYHCFAISSSTTGITDYLFSLSATAPTLPTVPTVFDKKRRIGAIRTGSGPGNLIPFHQFGKEFRFNDRVIGVNDTTPGTAGVLAAILTPLGVETKALLNFQVSNTTGGNFALITSPDETDSVPTATNLTAFIDDAAGAALTQSVEFSVKTNLSSEIRHRVTVSPLTRFTILVLGYIDETLEG